MESLSGLQGVMNVCVSVCMGSVVTACTKADKMADKGQNMRHLGRHGEEHGLYPEGTVGPEILTKESCGHTSLDRH